MSDELLLHGLVHVLGQASGVHVVGDVRHGADLVDRLRPLRPELLVVDVNRDLPLASLLAELDPKPKVVVVMDGETSPARALDLVRVGADALVDRRSPAADLLAAMARVVDGQTALDALSANGLIAELRSQNVELELDHARVLTRREREVLSLLTDGLDNRAIATDLFISEATVKFHLHNIMDKFGIHKRAALVSAALRGQGRHERGRQAQSRRQGQAGHGQGGVGGLRTATSSR
ncbi:response regulator transcription factor [Mycobacterium sp. NPDC006124]|uniref:response regulator transcription factor n=1 Tax=Mycobacterium sp. NPDC006124 TaxID=3156729 RepID=UPI0033B12F89